MRHLGTLLLLATASVALAPPPARAAAFVPDPIAGAYLNATNGGLCYVYAQVGGYLLVNENGDQAAFAVVRPGQLALTNTLSWDPNTVATVTTDRRGRVQIRFDSPRTPPGLWITPR